MGVFAVFFEVGELLFGAFDDFFGGFIEEGLVGEAGFGAGDDFVEFGEFFVEAGGFGFFVDGGAGVEVDGAEGGDGGGGGVVTGFGGEFLGSDDAEEFVVVGFEDIGGGSCCFVVEGDVVVGAEVELGFECPDEGDRFADFFDLFFGVGVELDALVGEGIAEGLAVAGVFVLDGAVFGGVVFPAGVKVEVVPEFFRDEGGEGVEQEEGLAETEVLNGEAGFFFGRVLEFGLGGLDVPVAEVVPDEGVEALGDGVEFEVFVGFGDAVLGVGELSEDGVVVGVELSGINSGENFFDGGVVAEVAGHLAEAGDVPEFGAEVASGFDTGFVEADVHAGGGDAHDAVAEAVGSVFGNEVEGVRGVAEGFGHFAALDIANDAGEVDVAEGDGGFDFFLGEGGGVAVLAFVVEFEAGHDHAGNPEEDDVGSGDEGGGWVVGMEAMAFHFLLVGPAHGGQGPEPGGGPGVEDVFVLLPVFGICGAFEGDVDVGRVGTVLPFSVPDGDAMSPPELAGDAPVFDVVEPVEVGFGPALWVKVDDVVPDGGFGFFNAGVFEEPLVGEAGFDGDVGPFGEADVVFVFLGVDEVALFFEFFDGGFAGFKAVHATEFFSGGLWVDGAVGVEAVDDGEVVAFADFEVEFVVSGGDFEHAGAEFFVDDVVGNDGDFGGLKWAADVFALEFGPAFILGMNGDGGVAHDGFGAGGGDVNVVAGFFDDFVADGVEVAFLWLHDNLFVGEGGEAGGAPVAHAATAVDVAVFVEFDEGGEDGAGVVVIEGLGGAFPVAGGSEAAELFEDDAAVFFFPFLGMFEEFFPTEVVFVQILIAEVAFDFGLGGDASMIGPRKPEYVFPFLTSPAAEDVLDGVVEHMAHGEDSSDVGWGDDDAVGLPKVFGVSLEAFPVQPLGVPAIFDVCGLVFFGEDHCVKIL